MHSSRPGLAAEALESKTAGNGYRWIYLYYQGMSVCCAHTHSFTLTSSLVRCLVNPNKTMAKLEHVVSYCTI